jgi:hypothetical protein
MINCMWIGNQARGGGGGLRNFNSSMRVVNSFFSGNSSSDGAGGGAYITWGSTSFTNTTFSNNQANGDGDGILNDGGTVLTLDNSIVWGNQDQEVSNAGSGAETHINFSIIQGDCPTGAGFYCLSVLDVDPQFKDADGADDLPGTLDDDLTLQDDSPAKDVGDNNLLPVDKDDLDGDGDTNEPLDEADLDGDDNIFELLPFDLDWNDRTIGVGEASWVDLGPFEIPFPTIYLPLVIKS